MDETVFFGYQLHKRHRAFKIGRHSGRPYGIFQILTTGRRECHEILMILIASRRLDRVEIVKLQFFHQEAE